MKRNVFKVLSRLQWFCQAMIAMVSVLLVALVCVIILRPFSPKHAQATGGVQAAEKSPTTNADTVSAKPEIVTPAKAIRLTAEGRKSKRFRLVLIVTAQASEDCAFARKQAAQMQSLLNTSPLFEAVTVDSLSMGIINDKGDEVFIPIKAEKK